MKRIIMAAMIVSLAACGGDKDDVATEQQQEWESQKQSLVYSFPDNNQQEVPVPSPVVLRFSSPVMETSPAVVLREVGGPVVSDFEMEWVDGKRGLIITPDSKLKPMTDYVVQVPAIELEKGVAPAKNIRFSTRALFEGPKSLVASDTFEVTRMIPDGENYQVMDFSSFRVQFSQPLDQTTVKYGDGADATVQLMGPEGVVDAHLLVSGHYMTIDPKEDLTPGAEYSLNMTTGITSTYGETLPGGSFGNPGDTLAVSVKVSPQDTKAPGTGLRVSMVQDVADTGELSPLTGMPINLVPMASVLLGEDTATQASGTIAAELAFVPNFPEATPFRVKRGSLIEGASIEVLIGGEVPAGFESGKVRMDFLSDATGYLLPNPYSNSDDAPRQVRLFMDVAVSTETPSANGAITQDLLHIELVGTSIVEKGQMVINAIGVVEPNVLGSERAKGVLSFYMKAFKDQDEVEEIIPPSQELIVISKNFKDDDPSIYKVGDPFVISFNRPIDSSSIKGNVTITDAYGEEVSFRTKVDGSSLIITTVPRMQRHISVQYFPYEEYSIVIREGIRGINGESLNEQKVLNLSISMLPGIKDVLKAWRAEYFSPLVKHSPLILATYPGYPCVLDESLLSIPDRIAGRCAGGNPGISDGRPYKESDDLIPILEHPSNSPIILVLSKDVEPLSVREGQTFKVEVSNSDGEWALVHGEIEVFGRIIKFTPETPWKEGRVYRYTMYSSGYIIDTSGSPFNRSFVIDSAFDGSRDCFEQTNNAAVCDTENMPVQTQALPPGEVVRLSDPGPNINPVTGEPILETAELWSDWHFARKGNDFAAGGPNFTQYFIGGTEFEGVIQILEQSSPSDLNANFMKDASVRTIIGENADGSNSIVGMEHDFNISEPSGSSGEPSIAYSEEIADIDPEGLKPAANFVKILSRKDGTRPLGIPDVNIGCGYVSPYDYHDPQRIVCPEDKFSAITGAIIAEVTNDVDDAGRVKVNIIPGQMLGSSIVLIPLQTLLPFPPYENLQIGSLMGSTGIQIMRMRYALDGEGQRKDKIPAWIYDQEGQLHIDTSIDLYVDAPFVSQFGTGISASSSNITSFPISIEMEGEISFLEDGRMRILQKNENQVDIPLRVKANSGRFMLTNSLIIPENGINLQFVSRAIK